VSAENPLADLLAAPLRPDWTIEGLAEQLLSAIASQPREEAEELRLDAAAATDRQSQRVLRPLLACLATKSAAEAGTPPNLYGGRLSFKRNGPDGPVWILGEFENKPGRVCVAFERSSAPRDVSEQGTSEPSVPPATAPQVDSPPSTERSQETGERKSSGACKQEGGPRKGAIRVEPVRFSIVIEKGFDQFDNDDREQLLDSIKQLLERSGEVRITRKTPG
jgi:hypothetical protein